MTEQSLFLKALSRNEDDTETRLVYADWLDEQGEHEEADRQRKWPAAKQWLIQFCKDNNSEDENDPDNWFISYDTLLQLGRAAIERGDGRELSFSCGNNEWMCNSLRTYAEEFWTNWSIVTGIPVPPDAEEKSWFRCAC